ncbi:hypothetical protein B0H11DRAFT_1184539 [Mycena galericulata]|nr:hypothetical protein B0H11DRAFT_1184539 [Mycena galericulata]
MRMLSSLCNLVLSTCPSRRHPLTPDATNPNSANLPPSLATAVAHTAFIPTTDPPLTARLQNTVICPVFDFTPYTKGTRVPVTSHNIETWKRNPEPLLDEIFVIRNEDGDDEPPIIQSYTRTRVGVGIGSAGKENIYYVQVAGEDEAVGYAAKEFFELLERSFCVSS